MNRVTTANHPKTVRAFIEMTHRPMIELLSYLRAIRFETFVSGGGIQKFIGRRPIFAFGNSDGDQQMLEWTAAGPDARFVGLVHHTDAAREWAYDRKSHIGKLDKALDEAQAKGWTVVDMKTDWNVVFPPEK